MTLRRTLALMLAAAVLFLLFSSAALPVLHADHDCSGEGCVICELLCACAQRLLRLAVRLTGMAAAAALVLLLRRFAAHPAASGVSHTLITQKVKLSN